MSTPNNEALVQSDEVCYHYTLGERVHADECTCLLCAGFDLDAICWHYRSGECSHNEECARNEGACFHPADLDPAWISLLATPPFPPLKEPPFTAERGRCKTSTLSWVALEVTYEFERGDSITLPIPYAASYSVSHACTSTDAEGQSSNTCAANLQYCWAPHSAKTVWPGCDSAGRPLNPTHITSNTAQPPTKKRRLDVDECPSAGDPHAASDDADMDVDLVDQFSKTTLDSEATDSGDGSAEADLTHLYNAKDTERIAVMGLTVMPRALIHLKSSS